LPFSKTSAVASPPHKIPELLRNFLCLLESSELNSAFAEEGPPANDLIHKILLVALEIFFLFLVGLLEFLMLQYSQRARHDIRLNIGH
jgi:hypothetical protein